MRCLSLLLVAAAVSAQSPLTTTFANNNSGAAGGAVYFELEALDPNGVTITDIDLHTTSVGVAATIDVYLQPLPAAGTISPGGSWLGPVLSGSGMTAGVGLPSNFDLSPDLQLGAGCRVGVTIVANGFPHVYTTATGGFQLLYQTAELELLGGQASNVPFTPGFFSPRLLNTNIHYVSGGTCPDFATAASQGLGCVSAYASFYELFAPAASADLANTEIVATNTGNGYSVITRPSTINPVGSLGLAMAGPTGDDVSLAVGTLGIEVYSNGQISFGGGNSTNWVPDVGVMLGNPAEAIYCWTDLSPNQLGSGQISYEENGTQYQVTYDGVHAFGTMDPSFIQIRGDTATGDFTVACGALHTTGPENWLFGYSPAGPSANPGASDLSAATVGFPSSAPDFYELFSPPGSVDLTNTEIVATNNGSGFDLVAQPSTINPIGSLGPVLAGPTGDDVQIAVGTLGIRVYSNCQVAFGAGNSTTWTPSVTTLLNNPATAIYAWTDLSPNQPGSGQISYEENGTQYQVTYDGVHTFGTMIPSTVQFRGDTATGDFTIACGILHLTGPEDWLFGFSVGGPSPDPGPTDLSSAVSNAITTAATDILPLSLTAVGRPVQGAAAAPFDVTTGNIPTSALSHFAIVGLGRPALPLDGLGMPGCFLHTDPDIMELTIFAPAAPPASLTWTALTLPAGPVFFSGFEFNAQAVVFGTTANGFLGLGALSSNGIKAVVGTL